MRGVIPDERRYILLLVTSRGIDTSLRHKIEESKQMQHRYLQLQAPSR